MQREASTSGAGDWEYGAMGWESAGVGFAALVPGVVRTEDNKLLISHLCR